MNLGENLKQIRRSFNLTQEKFAKKAGISRSYLSDLENNRKSPSIDTLDQISKKLGLSLIYLLEGKKTFSDLSEKESKELYNNYFSTHSKEDEIKIHELMSNKYLNEITVEMNKLDLTILSKDELGILSSALKLVNESKNGNQFINSNIRILLTMINQILFDEEENPSETTYQVVNSYHTIMDLINRLNIEAERKHTNNSENKYPKTSNLVSIEDISELAKTLDTTPKPYFNSSFLLK
ncbi:helix-turn-helix domain-containing protein [Vagococcus fluvialis]|uniref:helix-turn-helix domain-containing protein n=1 Tax=Vagococcus fluvialis TaxID=2738 RepID=UPI003D11D0A8